MRCQYWGVHWPTIGSSAKFCVLVFKASLLCYLGGFIGQSRFICQVLCIGIKDISAVVLGGPLAKEGSSGKFCVLVFKPSVLWYHWGGPSAKAGLSARFCILVCKASLLCLPGGFHQPNYVHLPSFVYWYSRHLHSVTWGSISQSRFICQVLCTGIQGISAVLPGGPSAKAGLSAMFLCTGIQGISALLPGGPSAKLCSSAKFCVTGIQGISVLLPGGPSAKEGSSGKFCVLVFKPSVLWYHWGGPSAKAGLSARFCILVCKASLLCYLGGPSSKLCSSVKFYVLVLNALLLCYLGVHQPK